MQIEKREYKVYDYNELSDEAKQKALEEFAYINVEDDTWSYDDGTLDLASEYGLKVALGEMCFNLERGAYVYFDAKHDGGAHIAQIFVEDYKKFAKKAGLDLRKEKDLDGNITIECEHLGGGFGRNYINVGAGVSLEAEKKLEEALKSFLEAVLAELRNNYEWRTSKEAVEDTINANEYKFLIDGHFFTL